MSRYVFAMLLQSDDVIEVYERMHADVDESVLEAHRRAGIRNYSIFRSGLDLFCVFEADNPTDSIARLLHDAKMEAWFKRAEPLLKYGEDGKPVFREFREVFYMP